MENSKISYILIFKSYNQAILLYNKLLEKGCNVELVSTPCRISKGCSQSVVFVAEDTKEIIEEIKESKVTINGIYKRIQKGNSYSYTHI
jgi:hypothetical protein